MKKNIITILICSGILGIISLKLASNKGKINELNKPVQVENIRIPVTAVAAKEEVQQTALVKTGTLAPFKEAKVLSVSSGNLVKLRLNPGDQVQEGQVLAVIDTRLLELDLQKAEANVSKLKRDLQTYTELLVGNAVTQEKVNDIRQRYEEGINQSQQLQRQIADASIKAPVSGIIATREVEEGMFVTPGTAIATIVNLSRLKVQVYLTEAEVYQVSPGQKIKITTDVYPDKIIQGVVSFISPKANDGYNFQVEITATNDRDAPLRSGTFAYVDFSRKSAKKILQIPREALVGSTQQATVFVASGGKALLRKIEVNGMSGGQVQVVKGLEPGEQVITSGQINLKDGALINVSK